MKSIESFYRKAYRFLEKLLAEKQEIGLNTQSHFIDHICYRVETLSRYEDLKSYFSNNAQLLIETPINGRRISTFKMRKPFIFQGYSISLLELPEPKAGSLYSEGFEHVEFVLNQEISFDKLQKINAHLLQSFNLKAIDKEINPDISIKLNSGTIKFHKKSLEDIICAELQATLNL